MRSYFIFPVFALLFSAAAETLAARPHNLLQNEPRGILKSNRNCTNTFFSADLPWDRKNSLLYHSDIFELSPETLHGDKDDFGIKEVVPREYRQRYSKWKVDLLSTEFGRKLWERYENNNGFRLTIVVVGDRKFGAATGGFEWDGEGNLVAATVTLGKDLDKGFPEPTYYPVMNSLAAYDLPYAVDGTILASTKFAHEIGHVNQTAQSDSKLFQRENKLMAAYYKIFLNNGYNTKDSRLVALANELGKEPIKIWEDREYWSEVSAMSHLVERIDKETFYCLIMRRIKRNIREHAHDYEDRFEALTKAENSAVCTG